MAHELAKTSDGRAMMMFSGSVPWHRLGTRLDKPATASEAMMAAGLDWEVELAEIRTASGLILPNHRATVRSDGPTPLGLVGKGYRPIQNSECFGFMDTIAAERKIEYHTAGGLGSGERVWMLAKIDDPIRVGSSDDTVDKFLLLSNCHDGRSTLRMFWTPIRVVCANTLAIAHRRAGDDAGISIRHTGNIAAKVGEAQRALGLATRFYDDLAPKIDALAGIQMTTAMLDTFFRSVYPDPSEEAGERAKKNAMTTRDLLGDLFDRGIGHDMPGIKGSAWVALNAVTEMVDHKPARSSVSQIEGDSSRLESIWFGSGAEVKKKAWSAAMELIGA